MDIGKYLMTQIRKCRNRMNLARLIDCCIVFAAAGGVPGMICELVSLVRPFYYAHLAAALCFGLGLSAGAGYALCRRSDLEVAARRLDSFGLKERMVTAYELMDRGTETGNVWVQMQRQDAFEHYNRARAGIKIPLWPDKRHVLALVLSAVIVAGLGFVPSPVREQARLRHQVQKEAEEEQKQLEQLTDALEGVDMESMTEEQRMRMQELLEAMQRSREELAQADTWESLGLARERLDYKYQQAEQSLAQLASQTENPGAAGIASAQALARAAGQNGNDLSQAGLSGARLSPGQTGGSGENGGIAGNGTGVKENDGGSGTGGNDGGNGSSGNGNDGGSGTGGNGGGNGTDGSGPGNQGAVSGEGGNGSGNGSGEGDGQGNGGGSGRGTGSSSATRDYVSIPNEIADDASLTGQKNGDQNSDYFRQQNGLAWEGNHVDYNSVISQYTDRAYEGISMGRYPSGMESVIRDYFENLSK